MPRKSIVWIALLGLLLGPGMEASLRAEEPAAGELEKKLAAKLEELSQLQREVDELRARIGQGQQLMVHVKIVEIDQAKADEVGVDLSQTAFAEGAPRSETPGETGGRLVVLTPEQAKSTRDNLDKLIQNKGARLVADPTLVTLIGRPAQMHVGEEVPIGEGRNGKPIMEAIGTKLELHGKLVGQNRVALEVSIQQAELKAPATKGLPPQIAMEQLQTSVQLNSGETCVLPGRDVAPDGSGKFKRYYLVTAELLGPRSASTIPNWNRTGAHKPNGTPSTAVPAAAIKNSDGSGPVGYVTTLGGAPNGWSAPPSLPAVRTGSISVGCREIRISLDKLREQGVDEINVPEFCRKIGLTATPVKPVYSHPVKHPAKRQWLVESGLEGMDERLREFTKNGVHRGTKECVSSVADGSSGGGGGESSGTRGVYANDSDPPVLRQFAVYNNGKLSMTPHLQSNGNVSLDLHASEIASRPTPVGEPKAKPETIQDFRTTVEFKPGQIVLVAGEKVDQPVVKQNEDGSVTAGTEATMTLYFLSAEVAAPTLLPAPVPPTVDRRGPSFQPPR